jgi:predicted dehydrogenase
MKFFLFFLLLMLSQNLVAQSPLRVGVIGLTHTHVHWILGRPKAGDIEIVGIVEPNRDLAERYTKQHGLAMSLVYNTIEEMVEKTRPEAVTAFNAIYDHLSTVEYCAPRGIHVMVEKPLAANEKQAQRMMDLAQKHQIHLLTNYETTWYGSNAKAYELIHQENTIGPIRRMVFHHGHPGPIEIGCNAEFLAFLTDPVLNGGGAVTDFGCYGANLATWLLKGEVPKTVFCQLRHIKPHLYPKVDDEATIVLQYANTEVIIQASWNWPYSRKDVEIYGQNGVIECLNGKDMLIGPKLEDRGKTFVATPLPAGQHDPFAYLEGVVRGRIKVAATDLSALENNRIVMQILEAAKRSASTGKAVKLKLKD